MDPNYTLAIKTVRHSEYADEYEGREGLMKLPYKMLLQQSEIRNGQLQSDNDELRDTIDALNARIAELEAENNDLKKGLLKEYSKEVRREEIYLSLKGNIEHYKKAIKCLRQNNSELLANIVKLQNSSVPNNNPEKDHV